MKEYDELEQYLRHDEPDKLNRGVAWATAIGLQQVDGLIMTGPTGTNVNDVSILLIKRE